MGGGLSVRLSSVGWRGWEGWGGGREGEWEGGCRPGYLQ